MYYDDAVALKQDDKVAALRARVEELKTQLADVKVQREDARAKRDLAYAQCHALQHERNVAQQERHAVQQERDNIRTELDALRESLKADRFREEKEKFQVWCENLGQPAYFTDTLAAWSRNMDAMRSPEFLRAYERGVNSGHILGGAHSKYELHIEWRAHMALWAASHAKGLEGDFVECGVNTGVMSLAICTYLNFNSLDKDFYLFDTYCGIPEEQMSPEERKSGIEHNRLNYEECFETAVRNFAPWPRCRLVRGKVPETLSEVNISKVAYLHIDMNIAAPERAALEFFWDKIVPGGVVLLDDYGFAHFRSQYESANEFAQSKGVMIATLPSGQGLILKR